MPSPAALDTLRTGTPDGSGGLLISSIVTQETGSEIPAGVALSDRIADAPTADRNPATAADTNGTPVVDMSTAAFAGTAGANLKTINNRGAVAVWCTFEASTDSATVRLVFYDAADNPLFVGPLLSFAPLAFRVSAAGAYMSEVQLVDSYGASQVRPYIVGKGNQTDDVFVFAYPI